MKLNLPKTARFEDWSHLWLGVVAALLVGGSAKAQTIYDLTLGGSVKIDNVYLFPGQSSAVAGSGTFGAMVRIQNNVSEEGYNSGSAPVMPDVKNGVNFRFGDFKVPANPGGMVNGVAYYSFSLDINEGTSTGNRYVSLDKLQFYVRSSDFSGVSPDTADTLAHLTSTATKVYDLDAISNNTILLDNSLVGGGSSSVDLIMLIPQSIFAPYTTSATNVFLYFQMGATGMLGGKDYASDTGFEEWNSVSGLTFTIPPTVPETGTVAAISGLAVIFASHLAARYRRRQTAGQPG